MLNQNFCGPLRGIDPVAQRLMHLHLKYARVVAKYQPAELVFSKLIHTFMPVKRKNLHIAAVAVVNHHP
jgi:hypothetical protein